MSLRIDHLRVRVGGRCLLAIPQLQIGDGERVALVGPNGAGKSTLLRVLSGQGPSAAHAPWQGQVQVLGATLPQPAAALRTLRAQVAVVHQSLHLVNRLSARDNLLIGALARCRGVAGWQAALLGRYPGHIEAEADAWLQRLGLTALAGARTDRLSGGERQRVAIGRAALQQPGLLLADEATGQLDPQAARQACGWLREAAGTGTLVAVLHQLDLLPHMADRVIGLRDGHIVLDRPVDGSAALQEALAALYTPSAPSGEPAGPTPHPQLQTVRA